MKYEKSNIKNILIVKIFEKRLDSSQAIDMQELINQWKVDSKQQVIIDLSHVDFIDSTMLGIFVQWLKIIYKIDKNQHNKVSSNSCLLSFCGVGFKIQSLLKLTRMDQVFKMYSHVDEAIHAVVAAEGWPQS